MMDAFEHDCVWDNEFDALAVEPVVEGQALSRSGKLAKVVEKYPAKLHAKRVAKFLKAEEGVIYLVGAKDQAYPDSDLLVPFRQNRHFYYITGVDIAGFEVTYDIRSDRLTLWIPHSDARYSLYNGYVPSIKECFHKYDVDDVRYSSELVRHLDSVPDVTTLFCLHAGLLPRSMPAAMGTVPHMSSPTHSLYLSSTSTAQAGIFTPVCPAPSPFLNVNTVSLQAAVDAARLVKTPYEINMIRKACSVSSIAHLAVAERFTAMDSERDVEAVFRAACTVRGAHRQAYAIIAGAGRNAATLHYDENSAPLKGKQLLVLDASCEWDLYASDITRTLPINGRFTRESRLIHDVVAGMQNACLAALKPNTHYFELDKLAQEVALDALLGLGILRGDYDEVRKSNVIRAFIPHGLGHPVGLEVHDFPAAYYNRSKALVGYVAEGLPLETMEAVIEKARLAAEFHRDSTPGRDVDVAAEDENAEKVDHLLGHQVGSCCSCSSGGYGDREEDWFAADAWARLREGMVLTIEPGIYFPAEYIEERFLSKPELAKFINTKVLERFYPVGGVRIEDVLLVTKDGYESLSTAPKGQALLDVINKRSKQG